MKKVIKIFIGILSIALLMLAGFIAGSYVQIEKYKQLNASSVDIETIAIVNMDSGVEVDGETINYASQLMDTDNAIYTVKGLSDAKQGIENNIYAAYIVIPDKFSEGVRAFYDNPEKMNVQYHYNEALDIDARVKAVENVNAFVNELNTNVAYMYVGTVLDEYHRVQDYVDALLANDNKELNNLSNVEAKNLIEYIDAANTVSVDTNVPATELSPYTSRNDALLGELEAGYNKAVEAGNEAYKDIKAQSELCKNSSEDLYNKFTYAVNTAKTNEVAIVKDGENEVMSVIGNYNDMVNKNLKSIQQQYNTMFDNQVQYNNVVANSSIDSLYNEYSNTVDNLNNNQKDWNTAYDAMNKNWKEQYDALNEGWAKHYDEAVTTMAQNLIECNNNYTKKTLRYYAKEMYESAYSKGYHTAIGDVQDFISDNGIDTVALSVETASDSDAAIMTLSNVDELEEWLSEKEDLDKIYIEHNVQDDNDPIYNSSMESSFYQATFWCAIWATEYGYFPKVFYSVDGIQADGTMSGNTLKFLNDRLGFGKYYGTHYSPNKVGNSAANKPNYNPNDPNANNGVKQAIDKSKYSVDLQRMDTNSEEVVNKTVEDFVAKFNLEDDYNKVKSVLSMEIINKLEAESKKQLDTLDRPIIDFKSELGKYNKLSEAHNPYNYISDANLNSFLSDISSNTSEMEAAVYKNNTDYLKYTMDVCDAANQNTENYKKAVDAAYDKTKDNVTGCIDDLKQSRVDTNKSNVDMINSFSETLAYTRIGSQANTKAYDCIINPVESNEIDKIKITKEQVNTRYLKMMVIGAASIAVLLCILIILSMLMKEKPVDEEVFYEE